MHNGSRVVVCFCELPNHFYFTSYFQGPQNSATKNDEHDTSFKDSVEPYFPVYAFVLIIMKNRMKF